VTAIRAVDTATHPRYQGKGIFRKLTLKLLDQCKSEGTHFVFNTPNASSKPGYLKMGWQEAGRLPVTASVINPIRIVKNLAIKPSVEEAAKENSLTKLLQDERFLELLTVVKPDNRKWITDLNSAFLRWRYEDVPVADYFCVEVGEKRLEAVAFARIKAGRLGRELRVTDVVQRPGQSTVLWAKLKQQAKARKADFITVSGLNEKMAGVLLPSLPIGPVVTVRDLNFTSHLPELQQFRQWAPSLGDLELF
jgi:hypothetical protein